MYYQWRAMGISRQQHCFLNRFDFNMVKYFRNASFSFHSCTKGPRKGEENREDKSVNKTVFVY